MKLTAGRVSVLLTLGCVLGYLTMAQTAPVRTLESKLLDWRRQWQGVQRPGTPLVIIAIDDKSLQELGRWPWSRVRFADIVRYLHAAGARVIAFDMLFLEPEVSATQAALQQVQEAFAAVSWPYQEPALQQFAQFLAALANARDADQQFASAIQEAGNVVLPFAFATTSEQHLLPALPTAPALLESRAAYRTLRQAGSQAVPLPLRNVGVWAPLPALLQAAHSLAHVTVAFDTDGTPRYDYPVLALHDVYYPSFAWQVARVALGLSLEEMAVHWGRGVQFGERLVPTDAAMRFLVHYYGPAGTFPTYAFADVQQQRVPATTFRDKIVLIGASALGLGDTFVTPFSAVLSGVERHASIIANILHGPLLRQNATTTILDLLSIVALGLLIGWGSSCMPWRWGPVFAVLVAVLYTGVNTFLFCWQGWWLHLLGPLGSIALNQGANTLYRFRTEEQQKRAIRQAFQYYLHPAVVEQVAQHPERLALGGHKAVLTVLFSDIRGFSSFSEGLAPEALVQLLNEYFSAMTHTVLQHHGMVDKYIGDAIMAVYGAPLPTPEHAYLACCTALQMLEVLRPLQARWQARGLPVIELGIGINTGNMVVGNMGSETHFNYTVMGDDVNLGARLEGVNKTFGTRIIISEATWEHVHERLATRELDVIRVKGKDQPTRIFELLGTHPLPPEQVRMVECFHTALQAYRAQQWCTAIACFGDVLRLCPDDAPSQFYLQRCDILRSAPPGNNWDGVYTMQTK